MVSNLKPCSTPRGARASRFATLPSTATKSSLRGFAAAVTSAAVTRSNATLIHPLFSQCLGVSESNDVFVRLHPLQRKYRMMESTCFTLSRCSLQVATSKNRVFFSHTVQWYTLTLTSRFSASCAASWSRSSNASMFFII